MRLDEKIIQLRKNNGLSQEDLADKLNISRQAISRWENGTALPDSNNILQLSKLFNVTTDYLLNDDYNCDNDVPLIKKANVELKSKSKTFTKLALFASIAFLISSLCWLYLSIIKFEILYVILTILNAFSSLCFIIAYEKSKKKNIK